MNKELYSSTHIWGQEKKTSCEMEKAVCIIYFPRLAAYVGSIICWGDSSNIIEWGEKKRMSTCADKTIWLYHRRKSPLMQNHLEIPRKWSYRCVLSRKAVIYLLAVWQLWEKYMKHLLTFSSRQICVHRLPHLKDLFWAGQKHTQQLQNCAWVVC